ncbi:MAG: pyruvate dehydrogenase complex dihydrolipoamide acetyltransferase [Proteobacteria bacterium]|nr:pyruvate dehydrogenase complex dihydrolipoamide acetyltransferase [Pseudomonadota bacterium]
MPIQILMPALSPTMTEGNLVKWLKNEGDKIKAGETIAEIETDKATMEVEAVDEGILGKIVVPAGTDGVQVNQLIAVILEAGEDASAINIAAVPQAAPKAVELPITLPSNSSKSEIVVHSAQTERVFASPLAKRLATEKGVNLHNIQGSGPHGRIVKNDIENFSSATAPGIIANVSAFEDIKLNGMRKTIAKRLTEAKQTIPHFYLTVDCAIDELLSLRTKINAMPNAKTKLSVNDFFVKAVALALMDEPNANVTFHGDYVRRYAQADVCVAVAIDGGLVTPVVKAANLKSLTQISLEVKDLAQKAKAGKLAPEAYQGGSFTISNLGMFGIKHFDAIINPPQACILAIGAGEQRPVVMANKVEIANIVTCTLSIDHRALDGAVGASFLKALKGYIENPFSMLNYI